MILDKIQGSLIGMALGDALGAHVEFRPYQYLLANPVKDLEGGGTWGLRKGQVLCLYHILHKRKLEQNIINFFITK
jgi:ADP-ribosylglycohydrolase